MRVETAPEARLNIRRGLAEARGAVMRPLPRMNVPDWADTYRHLSTSTSAVGGPWRTSRVEVARGPMMAVTEPGVRTVTAMTCTQLLKTSLLENVIGYFAHLNPCPMLLTQPKDEAVEAFSKERLVPLIQASPVLRDLMSDRRAKVSDDTLRYKKFPGGLLALGSAGSPTNLAMRAIRVVLMDEIDKYEVTKEGDPITLAEERMSTFHTNSLAVRACSPTWEETSRIYRSYVESDQRRPYVACPHCDHWQDLDFFRHVNWSKTEAGDHLPMTAQIYCEACGAGWSEPQRMAAVTTRGRIQHRQTRPFECCGERQEPTVERNWDWDEEHQVGYAECKTCRRHAVPHRHAGFTASKLYSPFISVPDLAKKWLESKDDPDTKQTFYNTQLGKPFRAEILKELNKHWLASRREKFEAEVPEGAIVLTAGLDVQSGSNTNLGRIEVEVVGWGLGEESWSVATEVFNGDPAKPALWKQVDEFLQKPFRHRRGLDMFIRAACIDSGGHSTQDVYNFARARVGRNVWAIKGASDRGGQWSPIWPTAAAERKHKKYRVGFKPVIVGCNTAKESVRQRLLIEEPGAGYCHFPVERSEAWFDQLTSENLTIERRAGQTMRRWVLQKGRANEALDCRAYAYAALQGLYHTRRLSLERLAQQLDAMRASPDKEDTTDSKGTAQGPVRRVRRNTWMSRG